MSPILRIFLVTSLVCVFWAPSFALRYKDCGTALSNLTSIKVSDCPKVPCTFKRGGKVNISISFIPNVEISKAEIHVWGLMGPMAFPFPIPNSDGCKDSGLTCPLKPKAPVTYNIQLDVKKIYPRISLIAKWKMEDPDKGSVFCFEIGVRLV